VTLLVAVLTAIVALLVSFRGRRTVAPPRQSDEAAIDVAQRVALSSNGGVVLLDSAGDVMLANTPAAEMGLVEGSRPIERVGAAAQQVRDTGQRAQINLSSPSRCERCAHDPAEVVCEVWPLSNGLTVVEASYRSDVVRPTVAKQEFTADVEVSDENVTISYGKVAITRWPYGCYTAWAPACCLS
jgi:two-component system sensor histidine kinase SenX3